jgi:DNA-binding GntR family transcriptional regulator
LNFIEYRVLSIEYKEEQISVFGSDGKGPGKAGIAMNEQRKRKTLSDEAYESITARIVDGRLAPGTRLVVSSLAGELQLSATPVNEALSALEREGLVAYAPHRGYTVRELDVRDIEELFTVREAIECLAVRLAAERADPAVLSALGQLITRAGVVVRKQDFETFYELDMEFHRAIYRASGNSLVARIANMIQGQMHLLVAKAAYTPGRFEGAHVEHEAILRHVRDRQPDAAEASMRNHVREAKAALLARARNAPADAAHGKTGALLARD